MKKKSVLAALIVLFSLSNCASIPTPTSSDESLLVVICDTAAATRKGTSAGAAGFLQFQGQISAQVELKCSEWTIKTVKLLKGSYQVHFDDAAAAPFIKSYDVKPHAVILFPYILSLSSSGEVFYQPVNGEAQQKAAQALINYIDFEQWLSSEYIGFGNSRPKIYLTQKSQSLTIRTDPPGARIFLDNIEWGVTPKTIELSQGKYLLRLEKEGFAEIKRVISVEANKEEYYSLSALESAKEVQKQETYSIMILPFINVQDENYNPYGNIFLSTFKVNFIKDKKLSLIQAPAAANIVKARYPDLALALKYGAELVVAGKYQESNGQLLVHAVLYDVQSGRTKYSVLYLSEAGFSVFDSIDEISLDFSKAVSRVLPRPGNTILEQEGDVSAELSAYEKQLYKSRIIAKRCSRRHILAAAGGLGMLADQVDFAGSSGGGDLRNAPRTPLNTLKIEYEYVFDPFISLSSSLAAEIGVCTAGDNESLAMDFTLFIGPKFHFQTSRNDIYLAAMVSASFAPALTVSDAGSDTTVGPYYYLGAVINPGMKFYLPATLSDTPFYIDTGIVFDIVTFRVNDFANLVYVPIHMLIYVGVGLHL